MKKLILFLFILCSTLVSVAQTLPVGCCPDFKISTMPVRSCDIMECRNEGTLHGDPGKAETILACKNSVATYYVTPADPAFTYTWTITGGTPTSATGPSVTITWGNSNGGTIKVVISNASGTCTQTILQKICLINAPIAAINYNPNTICVGAAVNFNGVASIGATTYNWSFGDGTFSNLPTPPPHYYTTPGPKTIILTVTNGIGGATANGQNNTCGCTDTAMVVVNVVASTPLVITTDSCKQMLCKGDTAQYCANTTGCSGVNWSVTNGTIIGPNNGSCVQVVWNNPSTAPPSITVNASCPGNTCSSTATMPVNVLYPNLPIQGQHIVCPNSAGTYSLPALPGTFYKWTLSAGGTIITPDSNHNIITVNWGAITGNYLITCTYNNPYSGCSGSDTFNVQIKPKYAAFGPPEICLNWPMPLAFSAVGNGNWSVTPTTGAAFVGAVTNTSTANINFTQAGLYNITVLPTIPLNYCSTPAVLTVKVKDTAMLAPIIGTTSVCAGASFMYSISSNQNGQFNWSVTNGAIVQTFGNNADSVLVNFTANGSISVTQNVNGCVSAPKVLNVNVLSTLGTLAGSINVCMDQQTTYTIAGVVPPGGYTWSLNNSLGSIVATTSNSVTIQWHGSVNTGTFTSILTVSACNLNSSLIINVKTPTNGSITSTGNLCASGVVLTANIPGAPLTFAWTLNGAPISGSTNTITVTTPGFYKVIGTGGCFGNATINVPNTFTSTVAISTNNVLTYCAGQPINTTFYATVQSNITCSYSYQWYLNGSAISLATGTSYNATAVGNYSVVISCGTCTATSNIATISVGTCDDCFAVVPLLKEKTLKHMAGPSAFTNDFNIEETKITTATLNVSVISSTPCNQPTFQAGYNFSVPNTVNSGVYWSFGDGTTGTSSWSGNAGTSNITHTYSSPGTYLIYVTMFANCPQPNGTIKVCRVVDTISYTVPVAAKFNYNKNCDTVKLINLSTTMASLGCNITSYSWSYTGPAGATFSNNTIANPNFIALVSGVYNISLTVTSNCGGCTATYSAPVTITLPSASFSVATPVCTGSLVNFNVTPTAGFNYNWNFGDTTQSNLPSTTHGYFYPINYTAVLTVIDNIGCKATASQNIAVQSSPKITVPSQLFICAGGSANLTCSTSVAVSSYQWYLNGTSIVGGTSATFIATAPGVYYVVVGNGVNCTTTSAKINVYQLPKPKAAISQNSAGCLVSGSASINLSTIYNGNYSYNWSVTPSGSFTSPTNFSTILTVNATGYYNVVVAVTDNITGCINKDTLCIKVAATPNVAITASGSLCEAQLSTLSVTAPNAAWVYIWSTNAVGTSISTSAAGSYQCTVGDPASGCFASSNTIAVNKIPYVALFPKGCDTLCDTAKIIPPLPLFAGQSLSSVYQIKWYVNGVLNYTGSSFSLAGLAAGNWYNINIVVNYLGNTCTVSSGFYRVYVKKCALCNCSTSHFNETTLTPVITNGNTTVNTNNTPPTNNIVKCGQTYSIKCNNTYNITSSYFCAGDTASCPPKVTYNLVAPNGAITTGTIPPALNFYANQQGTYTVTLYGWCGGKICDSCVLYFKTDCQPPTDCCKETVWQVAPWISYASTNNKPKEINCNESPTIIINGKDCKKGLTVGSTIKCPPTCVSSDSVFVYDGANNLVLSGPAPLNIVGLPAGGYTVQIIGYCNGIACKKCTLQLKWDCENEPPPCNCSGSHWGDKTIKLGNTAPINAICNKDYTAKCNQPININANYICGGTNCPGTVTYVLVGPTGTTTGTVSPTLNFTPTAAGNYFITLYGNCGGVICDSCKIIITVPNCPPPPCCPDTITATANQSSYQATASATLVQQNFTIGMPSGINITEVRANVVSYTLLDNFDKECLKCINYPFTWASINKAGNIGTAVGNINMGLTTTPIFTGTIGNDKYKNPREVIWNNSTNLNSPNITSLPITFILPTTPLISCCELKGRICVKFTFRNDKCEECTVISCFDFAIKK
jgi:hypothetical protein